MRSGTRSQVTEHGRSIATINPVETPVDMSGPTSSWRRDAPIGTAASRSAREAGRPDWQEDGFVGRARGSRVTLYLDTSSVIKLYVLEVGSDLVHALVGEAAVVATSAMTYAETRAGLARLMRDGV